MKFLVVLFNVCCNQKQWITLILGYNFEVSRSLSTAKNVQDAIEISVSNYFRDQLGLSDEFCRDRTDVENRPDIPKAVLNQLRFVGWRLERKRALDVTAGQGGMVSNFLSKALMLIVWSPDESLPN